MITILTSSSYSICFRALKLIKQDGKVDFQVREHALRWFRFSVLKELLANNGFEIEAVMPSSSSEKFGEQNYTRMWLVATAR